MSENWVWNYKKQKLAHKCLLLYLLLFHIFFSTSYAYSLIEGRIGARFLENVS